MTERAELGVPAGDDNRQVIVFKKLANPDGGAPRTLSVVDFEVRPLGYSELVSMKPNQGVTVALEMANARIVHTDIEGVDLAHYAHINATLESPFTAKAIGLVRGGWLPSALAATKADAVVLPDRNIISDIVGRFDDGQLKREREDFLDFFSDRAIRINPLLAAVEGNSRSIPTPASVLEQIEEAVGKIAKALPKARILVGERSLEGTLGLIADSRPGFERKLALLQTVAPNLASPVACSNVDQRWSQVIAAADEAEVPRNSLVVLALLSVLANPSGLCAAKRLLKPHASYGSDDAYNALSDLRSLEILISLFAHFPSEQIQLCTADKNLALFWAGIGASGFRWSGGAARFDLDLNEALLPQHYQERWREDTRQSRLTPP